MAVMPTSDPDDRSMPPMMMICVTPTAMMPIWILQDHDLQAQRIGDEALSDEDRAEHFEQQHHADHDAQDADLRRQPATAPPLGFGSAAAVEVSVAKVFVPVAVSWVY